MPMRAPRNSPGTGPVSVPTHPRRISDGVTPTSLDCTGPPAAAVVVVVAPPAAAPGFPAAVTDGPDAAPVAGPPEVAPPPAEGAPPVSPTAGADVSSVVASPVAPWPDPLD